MTQFCLVDTPEGISSPCCELEPVPSGEGHLTEAAGAIFGADQAARVVVPRPHATDFDGIFCLARREMNAGLPFKATQLFALLTSLVKPGVSIALWYGSDWSDLESTNNPDHFLSEVETGLNDSSVECYAFLMGQGRGAKHLRTRRSA